MSGKNVDIVWLKIQNTRTAKKTRHCWAKKLTNQVFLFRIFLVHNELRNVCACIAANEMKSQRKENYENAQDAVL